MLETEDHIFLDCPAAIDVWTALGVTWTGGDVRVPWSATPSADLPLEVWKDVILIILWQIWKPRNF